MPLHRALGLRYLQPGCTCVGGFCCTGSDKSLRLWEATKGTCHRIIKQHTEEVTAAVWLPAGDRIITSSPDKNMVRLGAARA